MMARAKVSDRFKGKLRRSSEVGVECKEGSASGDISFLRSKAQAISTSRIGPMFEQAFKNIDDVLRKEAGCTTELDYTEQTSWLLFLKYLDGLEQDKATEAALEGKKYTYILDKPYRWESWAAPKGKDGKLDHNKALTGDDLRDFVNAKLFPYLQGFTQ
jgi:hypothetical protein